MDVNDLKGLFAEVKKRMDAQLEHVRRELAACAPAARRSPSSTPCTSRPTARTMPLNQVASPLDPRADADRGAAVRSVADGRDRKGDPQLRTSA